VRRFWREHLPGERNLAANTQRSYRDTLRLLLPFVARRSRKPVDRRAVTDLSAERIQGFLRDLEAQRGCGIATRNQRPAAIRSLAHFVGMNSPGHVPWWGASRAIPFPKAARSLVTYLEKDEREALRSAPEETTTQGRRDRALLRYRYNTGARADEVAQGRIADVQRGRTPGRDASSVLIPGKGNKPRRCPRWARTAEALRAVVGSRAPSEAIFRNRRGQPLTRFGIHALVERYAAVVAVALPAVARKRVSPHTIRPTTAAHLLRAGVAINTIRAWLGPVALHTTNVYAEVDREMKAKALANGEVKEEKEGKPWRQDTGLMEFLRAL